MNGWLRIYIVLTAMWGGWFGYQAWDGNRQESKAMGYLVGMAYEAAQGKKSAYNQTELQDWADEQRGRRDFALKALPIIPLGLPVFYFLVMWIAQGFKRKPLEAREE